MLLAINTLSDTMVFYECCERLILLISTIRNSNCGCGCGRFSNFSSAIYQYVSNFRVTRGNRVTVRVMYVDSFTCILVSTDVFFFLLRGRERAPYQHVVADGISIWKIFVADGRRRRLDVKSGQYHGHDVPMYRSGTATVEYILLGYLRTRPWILLRVDFLCGRYQYFQRVPLEHT